MYFRKLNIDSLLNFFKITEINSLAVFLIIFLSIFYAAVEGLGIALIFEIIIFLDKSNINNEVSNFLNQAFLYTNLSYNFLNLCIVTSILIILRYSVEFTKMTYYSWVETNAEFKLREHLINGYLRSSVTFFVKHSQGDLNFSLTQLNQAVIIFRHFFEIMSSVILSFLYIFIFFTISIQMTLFTIGLISLSFIVLKVFSINFQKISSLYSVSINNLNKKNIELFNSYKVIKTRNIESFFLEGFQKISQNIKRLYFEHHKRVHLNSSIGNCTLIIGVIVIVYCGYSFFNISTSELALFLYIMSKLANNVIKSNTALLKLIHSNEILKRILSYGKDSYKYCEKYEGKKEIFELKKSILFKNVSFSFNKSKILIKNNIEFFFKKKTTIIGKSGSGKTTIVNLLLRLIDYDGGNIFIDGKSIKEIDIKTYRKLIGMVPQKPYFFYGSIKENLTYGLLNLHDKDIQEALELSNSDEFVSKLEKKENTIIKDNGENFSGGQLQRLSLARTLLQKPKIIILDEPTNALDPEAEKQVINVINKLSKNFTIICISHSISLIQNSDYIVYIENGKILANDKYINLRRKDLNLKKFLNL